MLPETDGVVMRDVTHAGLVVSDRINNDISNRLDLEDSLAAARLSSHPYTTHPKEVVFFFVYWICSISYGLGRLLID